MKKKIALAAVLTLCAVVPLFIAQAGDDAAASIKNSIRHRCVLECVWAKERSPDQAAGEAFVKKCGEGCMDKQALEVAAQAKCKDQTHVLFFDMYHCGAPKPWQAPKGFTRPPRG